MKTLNILIKRNCKLFFKDKGLLLTAIITPMILLVLYATFLSNIYRDIFVQELPAALGIPDGIINGLVSGQLLSSLLAVSCVTVSFCCNMLMVQDKVTGARNDLIVSPVKQSTLSLSYYVATLLSTLLVMLLGTGAGLGYVAAMGWYLSAGDVACLVLDVFLLVMFGTALSSIINTFLSTQGQISAVGSIVSSMYGFVCGAYMPISNFSVGLQRLLSFLPGTYGTCLVRQHCMGGAFRALADQGLPESAIQALRDAVDCSIYFFDSRVSAGAQYAVLGGTVAVLVAAYVALSFFRARRPAR